MKKIIKHYRDLETGGRFTVDLSKVFIYDPSEDEKENEERYQEFEKQFSEDEIIKEEKEHDNTEEEG